MRTSGSKIKYMSKKVCCCRRGMRTTDCFSLGTLCSYYSGRKKAGVIVSKIFICNTDAERISYE